MQAMLLLSQTLDMQELLALVAANDRLTTETHRFGGLQARQRVHEALGKWWAGSESLACTPVLLAWAAFTALANTISEGVPPCSCDRCSAPPALPC